MIGLFFFDSQDAADHGFLQYMGKSNDGSLVFSVGFETASTPVIKAVKICWPWARPVQSMSPSVETREVINILMIIGGILSRCWDLLFSAPLVAWGTQLAYKKIVALVEATERKIKLREQRGQ